MTTIMMAVMVAFKMKIQTLNQPMTNLDWGEIGFFCNIITVPVFPDHPDINRITNPIKGSVWSKTPNEGYILFHIVRVNSTPFTNGFYRY